MQFEIGEAVRTPDGQQVTVNMGISMPGSSFWYLVVKGGVLGFVSQANLATWQASGGALPGF